MNCYGCVYYKYESDTNFSYCSNPNQEFIGQEECINGDSDCYLYYAIADAKADAKYGQRDKY